MNVNDKFYHSVRLDESLCNGCINCIKRCPTEAIRVRNGKAIINNKFCIDCAECIRVCSHHAKVSHYDKLSVMNEDKYTIALPPPSLYSQFNNLEDINIVLNGLISMGFDAVFEVSAAAEIVSETTRLFIEANKSSFPYISTACPTVVRLVRVRFPNLIPYLLPIQPPVEVAAIAAVNKAIKDTGLPRDKIATIFISPCPSKVTYAKSPLGVESSEIDYVVAMKDVYTHLIGHMNNEVERELAVSGKIGISWGRSGGEASGLLTENYLAADGIENVINVLENLEDQKFTNLEFVELNACSGGCVGGVLTVENPYAAESKLKRLRKYMPVAGAHLSNTSENDITWTTPIEYEPVFNLGNTMTESFQRLSQVERLCKKLPGLDCGSCGAPTCKSLAEDIVRGEAVENDCVYHLKENLHKLSQEVSILADSISNTNRGEDTINRLRGHIQKLSDEMATLDHKTRS